MDSDRKIAAPLPPTFQQTPHPPVNGPNNEFSQARHMHGRTSGPTRRSTRGQWTPDEDEILRAAVHRYKGKNWKKIAESFKDRTDVQCLHRWQKVLNPDLIKGPWSKEEDEIIVQMVKKYGPKKWSTIAQHLPGRIGKQCRERWHNHLNPGINKEAWTQEEELVLIHAHQLYGNKWAELTKFLPGRTDNSIKNHWNSSVKKKLDSYKASGLLHQFQDLALISLQSQSLPIGGEDISECSQVGCSQTASDMSNAICQTREDFIVSEESDQGKIQKNSPTPSCSEQYYTSLDDMTFTISCIPCEFTCSSNYLEENFAEASGSGVQDCVFGAISLPMNSSSDLDANSCLPQNYFFDSVNDTDANVAGHIPKAEEGCSQIISTQIEDDGSFERSSDVLDMERYNDYMSFQSTCQFSGTCGTNASQPYSYTASVLEASNCDNMAFTPKVSGQNGSTMEDKKLSQTNDSSPANTNSHSPCHNPSDAGFTEQIDLLDPSGLIPGNTLVPEMSNDQQITPPRAEQPVLPTPTSSTLCYEPPRFPSLEIPFFSCDLAQSGNDAQQDFSPLGIRQLMSSASFTPFKLCDSSDDSPNALLKSAAKTFARTPSILKKRHRDLLSPLSPFSERRYDKKTGNDVNQGFLCTSRLTKEFSRLDVIFDEAAQCMESTTLSNNSMEHPKALVEDKENICPNIRGFREGVNHRQEFKVKPPQDTHTNIVNNMENVGTSVADSEIKFSENCTSETPRGILVEHNLNDTQFSSPVEVKPNTGLEMSDKAAEAASLNNTSKDSAFAESTFRKAGSFVFQPSFDYMKQIKISAVSSSCQQVSAVPNVVVDSLVNEVGAENLNFFGGTPFRRSMESPSAWKSPWYFSSLVSCPRFEPDITIEDIGIFMSPGERSLDAIGLMKQINEQGADTYANAKEVLGSETPESILRQRCSTKINLQGENNDVSNSQLEDHLHRTSNAMMERRVLDFSECGGTPDKSIETMECLGAACLSSPC